MTPGARVAAAIRVLDAVIAGESAERELLRWARGARYAGSGDRAAVRDHVFSAVRNLRSAQAIGGAGGRGAMIGMLSTTGRLDALFDGAGHAPEPLAADERARLAAPRELTRGERLNLPDWLLPEWDLSLGERAGEMARLLGERAPVHLRANLAVTDAEGLIAALAGHGIASRRHPASPTAVEIEGDGRRLRATDILDAGLAEPQDAGSQAIADMVPGGGRILDYCAGGGGKALAIAARTGGRVEAHDAEPARMSDLPRRAVRAGAEIALVAAPEGPYDAILCDVPCSGSGAWRRQPEAKWRLTPDRLADLGRTQDAILDFAAGLLCPAGSLIYATCSLLRIENDGRIDAFLERHPGWRAEDVQCHTPAGGTDGFYGARLTQREVEI